MATPDYPTITPADAAACGYRAFDVRDEDPNLARYNRTAMRTAETRGWNIVGKWDEQRDGIYVRTYWCDVNR